MKKLINTYGKPIKYEAQSAENLYCTSEGTDPFEIIINENNGTLTIKHCYGAVTSQWFGQRNKLKSFILRMDDGYLIRNFFSSPTHFYASKTRTNLNKTIKEAFKEKTLLFDEMLQIQTFLKENIHDDLSYNEFLYAMEECPFIGEVWDYYDRSEIVVYGFKETVIDHAPRDLFFINKILPCVRPVLEAYVEQIGANLEVEECV